MKCKHCGNEIEFSDVAKAFSAHTAATMTLEQKADRAEKAVRARWAGHVAPCRHRKADNGLRDGGRYCKRCGARYIGGRWTGGQQNPQ
jgi:hypothetical protein